MQDFQAYQADFTAHIRSPKTHTKPKGIAEKRMAIYREIVLNNFSATVSACYPVCRSILGERSWAKLVRDFFANGQMRTPIFHEIPAVFCQHLQTQPFDLALKQLAHYEWVELKIQTKLAVFTPLNLLINQAHLALNPTAHLLQYDVAVHTLSKKNYAQLKDKPVETYLLVFRNADFKIEFIALNAATFDLLQLLANKSQTASELLQHFADSISQPVENIADFGLNLLAELAEKHAIVDLKSIA